AEDGIRDFHVTGVQTCALPISCRSPRASLTRRYSSTVCSHHQRHVLSLTNEAPVFEECTVHGYLDEELLWGSPQRRSAGLARARSEERRVGKEGSRSWWPNHE